MSPNIRTTIREAVRLLRQGAPRPLLEVVAGQLIQALTIAGLLVVGRWLLSTLSDGTNEMELTSIVPALVVVAVLLTLHGSVGVWVRESRLLLSEHTTRHVHARIIDVTTSIDFWHFETAEFHDRLGRAQERATQSVYGLVYGLMTMVEGLLGLTVVTLLLSRIMPELLLGAAAIGAPLLLVALAAARLSYRVQYELTTDDRRRRYLQQLLIGSAAAKEIRLFELREPLTERWATLAEERVNRMDQLRRQRVRLAVLGNAVAAMIVMAALAALVARARWGVISAADTAVAALAFQQMASRIRSLSEGAGNLRLNAFVLDDLTHLIGLTDTAAVDAQVIDAQPSGASLGPLEELTLDGLSFRYPGTNQSVLEDIDLVLRPGKVVALVGANGSGKSTLAKLLCGLYAPTSGTMRWNGDLIAEPSRLAQAVTAIHQDHVRYELTADENIAVGKLGTRGQLGVEHGDRISLAAELAGATPFLDKLSQGRNTVLSRAYDGGADLSGGQWQRVAIARALFHQAPLVVMDEPTAALDAVAERDLFETMRASFSDRAIVLISHRFSSVRHADEICVFDNGQIVERGTHAQLLAQTGRYADLFMAQSDAYFSS